MMKVSFLPKTKTGLWGVILTAVFAILMAIKIVAFLPIPTPALAVLGVIGFVVSIIAVVKAKDRSILIFVSLLVGLLLTIFIAGEFIFPH